MAVRRLANQDYVLDIHNRDTGEIQLIDDPEHWYRIECQIDSTKNVAIQVRVTLLEREELRKRATAEDKSISQYIRSRVFAEGSVEDATTV